MSTSETQPLVLLRQFNALHNVALLCAGLWFHDIVTHLHYDWKLFRKPDAGRPTVARLAKWVLIKFLATSGLLGLVCASNLLSIRVAAIWSWDKRIISILVTIAVTILGFGVYFMVELTSAYDPTLQSCNMSEVHSDLLPALAVLAGDCIVLALLLTGLQRNWREARQVKNRMWHILWTQGLLYLFTAAVVEVPIVVLLLMNINPIMNTMMITPVVIFLSICATRMYRFLNKTVQGQSEMFTNGVSQGAISTVRDDEVQLASIRKGSSLNTPCEIV